MRYNLKSVKIVLFCTTNTTTNTNEIKALTRVESETIMKDIFVEVHKLGISSLILQGTVRGHIV